MVCSKKLGEIKGPLIVWLFFTFYLVILPLFTALTTLTLTSLLIQTAEVYGVFLVFLIIFLALWEKKRSLIDILCSLGIKGNGTTKSVLWSFALLPLFIVIGLMTMTLGNFLVTVSTLGFSNQQFPVWYMWYQIISSFFPVAFVEEAIARGYILDRLMYQHPSSLAGALPAILLSSLLFTLYHLPTYLRSYPSQIPLIGIQAINVFLISVVLGVAYVRARTGNIIGPILVHFLLDAMPIALLIA